MILTFRFTKTILDNYEKRLLPRTLTIKILCDIRQPSMRSHFRVLEGKRLWVDAQVAPFSEIGSIINSDLSDKSIRNLNDLCHLKVVL